MTLPDFETPDDDLTDGASPDENEPALADEANEGPLLSTDPAEADVPSEPADPAVAEAEADSSFPTAEQMDADARSDQAEQDALDAEDEAEQRAQEAEEASEERDNAEAALYRQHAVLLQEEATKHASRGTLGTILHALNPFASDDADAESATLSDATTPAAPPQQQPPASNATAPAQATELPPLEDKRLAELASTVQVTPEEVAEFKRMNPLFSNFDDARAMQALQEITASAMLERGDRELQAAEEQHLAQTNVEPIPLPQVSLWERVKGGLRDYALHPQSVPQDVAAVGAGVAKGALESYDAVNEIALGNPPNPGDWRKGFEDYYSHLSGPSSIAATVAQWATAFVGLGKFARLTGLAKGAEAVKGGETALNVAKGAGADFLAFDGHAARISDLVQNNPAFGTSLANPVTDFLASKPDDTEAEGRLKNAIEGAGLGLTTDVVMHMFGALRAARAGDKAATSAATEEAIKSFDDLNASAPHEAAPVEPEPPHVEAEARNAEASEQAAPGESSTKAVSTPDAIPPNVLPREQVEAAAKQIAGDLASDPMKRPLFADPPAMPPAPSTFDSLTSADDLRAIVQATEDEILKGIDGSLTQANGSVSVQESQRLASEFAAMTGTDEGVFFNRMAGDASSIQQLHARLLAYDQTTRVMASGIRDMALAIRKAEPGIYGTMDGLQEAFTKRLAAYAQVQDWLKGVRSETGRTLNIMRHSRTAGAELPAFSGEGLSQAFRDKRPIADLVEDVLGAGTDRGALARVADPTLRERWRDALISLYIKNILSGPTTHVGNIIGNTLAALTHPAAKIVGGIVRTDAQLIAEGVRQYGYMLTESRNALKLAAEAYKRGNAILDNNATKFSKTPLEALDAGRVGLHPESISGKLFNAGAGLLNGVSTRALEAADEFFKQTVYSSEVMSRAFTDGVNLKLTGDDLQAYVLAQRDAAFQDLPKIGSRVANTEGNANAAAALDVARFSTFTQDVPSRGIAASALATTNKWPLLKFAVPFVRVVNNILDYSASLTPGLQRLSRLYKDQVARGGREAAIAQGRLAMGAAMWTSALGLAAGGYITGPGTDDYRKRQELEQTGWRAHSLKIGDTYIDLNRLDPIGFPFNLAGEFYQRWQEAARDDESAVQVAAAMALALYHNISDRSFLKGFTDLFDAIGDKDGSQLARFAANVTGSLLVPNIVRQAATNNSDPYLHEARGFIENIMRRVPGLSDNLAARRMPWGEKMLLNPSLYAVKKADPLMQEYARLLEAGDRGAPDPLPRMKPLPGDKPMDLAREMLPDGRNLYDVYGDLVMQPAPDAPPLRDVLKQLMGSPEYAALSDGPGDLQGTKLWAWRRIIGRYRAAAWRAVLTKYPAVLQKVYAKKRDMAHRMQAVQQSIEVENYLGQ